MDDVGGDVFGDVSGAIQDLVVEGRKEGDD